MKLYVFGFFWKFLIQKNYQYYDQKRKKFTPSLMLIKITLIISFLRKSGFICNHLLLFFKIKSSKYRKIPIIEILWEFLYFFFMFKRNL